MVVKQPPNQEAHHLLTGLIGRLGLTRRGFLDRLSELGFAYSEHDLANWGRSSRAFPRDWAALRAMIQAVTEGHPDNLRCTAMEALRFLKLVEMPFSELPPVAALFFPHEFQAALESYLPSNGFATPRPLEPYVGLRTFHEEDAAYFFGREKLIDLLLQKVAEEPFLAVLGPSGSGKSSVVRAGLIPALKHGGLPGSEKWRYVTIRPGRDPLRTLAATVVSLQDDASPGRVTKMRDLFAEEDRVLLDETALLLVGRPETRLVLVVDQFEEVWTLNSPVSEREAFIQSLLAAATYGDVHEPTPLMVILTLRADFLPRAAEDRDLARYIGEHDVIVSPMKPDELYRAIEQPALKAGGSFEPALVDELIGRVMGRSGALPLLEYTLRELWRERRLDGTITWEAFRALGGVEGALAARADSILTSQYTPAQQEELRHLLLHLVQPSEGAIDARRRVLLDDLIPAGHSVDAVQALLTPLVNDRLLTADQDPATGEETIELSHEALIRAWPTFEKWIEDARDDLRFQAQLEEAAKEWESNRQSPDFLWQGLRLAHAEGWLARANLLLPGRIQQFLDASRQEEQARSAAREVARRERETLLEERAAAEIVARDEAEARAMAEHQRAEEQAKARKRLGVLAFFLLVLLLLAAGTAWTALNEQRTLDARRLAFAAQSQMENAPETALLLAIEAVLRRHDFQSEQALRDALESFIWRPTRLTGHEDRIVNATFSPTGNFVLTASDDGTARLWDLEGQSPVTLPDHEGRVLNAVFSPDENFVLTASDDGTARLWDLEGRPLVTFTGHEGAVTNAVFNPDGHNVLTASGDGTAQLWDLQGNALLTFAGHEDGIVQAVFSPDGEYITTASSDGTARLWNLEGQTLAVIEGHGDEVEHVSFSPDGGSILTASRDGIVQLSDLTGQLLATFPHSERVRSAIFSPDGQYILTASARENTALLWDLDGHLLTTFYGHTRLVLNAAFSPDGQRILTGSDDGTARLWRVSGQSLATFKGHTGSIASAVFSPDGEQILTASWDSTARLWEEIGPPLPLLQGHEDEVGSAVFTPDGQHILTASADATARLWGLTGQSVLVLTGHEDELDIAIPSPDGQHVLTASEDGTARLWNREGEVITTFPHEDAVGSAVFSPDGQRVLTASNDGTAQLWSLDGQKLVTIAGHEGELETAVFSPDGQNVLTASDDGTARMWNMEGQVLVIFAGHEDDVDTALFSPDGQYVVTASEDDTARLWDLEGNTLAVLKHDASVDRAIFSPNGKYIITPSRDRTARLWDLNGNLLVTFKGHTNVVKWAEFSPDGQYVLTASDDSTVRLWNLDGQLLTILRGHNDWIATATFSPDARRIVTASRDHTARQFLVNIDDLLALAICRTGRGLTDEEVEQFNVGTLRFIFEQRQCSFDSE